MSQETTTEPPAVKDLLAHVLDNGGRFHNVELKYSKTEDSILQGPLSVILDMCPDILAYPDEVMAMALMSDAYSPNSLQAKHIASLPKAFNTPIFWSEDELLGLKGSTVWHLTNMMKKQIVTDWQNIHAPIVKIFPELLGRATIETYKWALSVIYSRAVGITRDGVYVRVIPPLIDMANHSPDVATEAAETLNYSPLDDSVLYICNRARSPGQECHAFYGNYSNAKLLYTYGFVIPNLPLRAIDMWNSISSSVPFAEVKQQILQSNDLTKNQTYDFEGTLRSGGWISPSLLAAVRITQASAEEFQIVGAAQTTEAGDMRSTYEGGFVSHRNEVATFTSLRELLYAKLRQDTAEEERLKFEEDLLSESVARDDRRFMSLLIRVEDRRTVEECLDVVLLKLKALQDEKI